QPPNGDRPPDQHGQPQLSAEPRTVQTGERRDGVVVITQGLAAGEQVVTAGQLKLTAGAAIRAGQAPAPQRQPGAERGD
ncbi:MAG TPA: efflux transporter periplasmic adaptor subunit, partial [Pseudomonas sp.]|nr:efflux transporter periplasmic adaptor subunit [Pseudomonas sp.]